MSTSRISSVAYATEDSGSEANTASATVLLRRSCRAWASGIGTPTRRRLTRASRISSSPTLRRSVTTGADPAIFLRIFNARTVLLDAGLRPNVPRWGWCPDVRHDGTFRMVADDPSTAMGPPVRAGRAHAGRAGGGRGARFAGPRAHRAQVRARPRRFRRDGSVDATQPRGTRSPGLVRLRQRAADHAGDPISTWGAGACRVGEQADAGRGDAGRSRAVALGPSPPRPRFRSASSGARWPARGRSSRRARPAGPSRRGPP